MLNISKTLVFFGNERLVSGLAKSDTPILKGLIKNGYTVSAVVSRHNGSRSRNSRDLEVADVAREYNIPVLTPENPADIISQLESFNAEVAVLVAYGRIIPQMVIDVFPKGIINIHPSLLPKYRGSTPIESAILNGDKETGISIMQLSADLDEGPIYKQVVVPIKDSDDKFSLYTSIAQKSADILLDTLPMILDNSLHPQPQKNEGVSYSHQFSKEDSRLDVTKHTSSECVRIIRAYLGFPKSKLNVFGHDIVITKAHVSPNKTTSLDIVCKNDTILCVDELIGPSGRTMDGQAFINGYAAG